MALPSSSPRHTASYERVLGTSMEIQIAGTAEAATLAEEAALVEIDRLEGVFSRYREDSELVRWERTFDEEVPVSTDFARVLRDAEAWRERTKGAFDPVMAPEAGPRWSIDGDHARRLTRRPASLHAIAKGFIIDRAAEAAMSVDGVSEVLLNVGGDLRHLGSDTVVVGITDPFEPYENAESLLKIAIRNQGVATSGTYRRGAHLIDPRTGKAADHVASSTVVAESAVAADALATAFFVLSPRESLRLADELDVAVLLVLPNRKRQVNKIWRRLS